MPPKSTDERRRLFESLLATTKAPLECRARAMGERQGGMLNHTVVGNSPNPPAGWIPAAGGEDRGFANRRRVLASLTSFCGRRDVPFGQPARPLVPAERTDQRRWGDILFVL
mmetsp:Transcript_13056/g.27098  ORF Transcript_13056/g.27098 Transcript_13056/m.27098 type:complete len:112 (-) Transcript_13056:417-752(-)